MLKQILDDVSNATKIPSQSSDWRALMRLRTPSPALCTAYKKLSKPLNVLLPFYVSGVPYRTS